MKRKTCCHSYLLYLLSLASIALASQPEKHCGDIWRVSAPEQRRERSALDELHESQDTPVSIVDLHTASSSIYINTQWNTIVDDIDLYIAVTHPWIRDLRIILTAPNGTEILIMDLFPGDYVENMDADFDSDAERSIHQAIWESDAGDGDDDYDDGEDAHTPLITRYAPLMSLDLVKGIPARGTWTLSIFDRFLDDQGSLDAWGIYLNHTYMLAGKIVSLSGDPIANAEVTIPFPYPTSTFSESDGCFAFLDGLFAGVIRVSAEGYLPFDEVISTPGNSTSIVTIKMTPQ